MTQLTIWNQYRVVSADLGNVLRILAVHKQGRRSSAFMHRQYSSLTSNSVSLQMQPGDTDQRNRAAMKGILTKAIFCIASTPGDCIVITRKCLCFAYSVQQILSCRGVP